MQEDIMPLRRLTFFADITVASPMGGKTGKYNFRSATGKTRC
jgi:hypothetical protein